MHASGEWRQPSEKEATILRCVVEAKLSPAQWEKIWEVAGLENVVSVLELYEDDFAKLDLTPLVQRRVKTFQSLLTERVRGDYVSAHTFAGAWNPPPPPPALDSMTDAPPADYVPFDGGTNLCRAHMPTSKRRRGDLKYWFFNAVIADCKDCVRFCVERHWLDKYVTSDTCQYTAEDFAAYYELDEMVDFLETI